MKYIRFKSNNKTSWGTLEGDTVKELSGNYVLSSTEETNNTFNINEVEMLSPVEPGKVIAIGLNYKSHLGDRPAPEVPEPFFKLPDTLIGHNDDIIVPKEAHQNDLTVQPEAELCLVVGKGGKRISQENALSHVFGYTCGNDVSVRNWQKDDLQWWRAKSCDTFTVVGPWIETEVDAANSQIVCRINGNEVQNQNTSDLLHGVPRIIEFVSSMITLNPGDVIMTGTPGEPKNMYDGDIVDVEIEGIGILSNKIKNES
tara:strand:+ start:736 stop:1506 length:771 start_codon:yes stop_codon:yes gene_type:complete